MNESKNHTAQWLKNELEGSKYPFVLNDKIENKLKKEGFCLIIGKDEETIEIKGALNKDIQVKEKITQLFSENKYNIQAIKSENDNCYWTFKTDIPCSTFTIMDYDEPFCKGLIINIEDLK